MFLRHNLSYSIIVFPIPRMPIPNQHWVFICYLLNKSSYLELQGWSEDRVCLYCPFQDVLNTDLPANAVQAKSWPPLWIQSSFPWDPQLPKDVFWIWRHSLISMSLCWCPGMQCYHFYYYSLTKSILTKNSFLWRLVKFCHTFIRDYLFPFAFRNVFS